MSKSGSYYSDLSNYDNVFKSLSEACSRGELHVVRDILPKYQEQLRKLQKYDYKRPTRDVNVRIQIDAACLIDSGLKGNNSDVLEEILKFSSIGFHELLINACNFGKVVMIKMMINTEYYKNRALLINGERMNALHIAVDKNKPEVIELLLADERCLEYLKAKDLYGRTPLDIAATSKNTEAIGLLTNAYIKHGENIPVAVPIDKLNQYVLNSHLVNYLRGKGVPHIRNEIINSVPGSCNGWAFEFLLHASQGKENEFYDILQAIHDWDGMKTDYDLNYIILEEPITLENLIKYQHTIPLLIKDNNDNIWIYGKDANMEPKLTKLYKKALYSSLAFSNTLQKIHTHNVPTEIYQDIVSRSGHNAFTSKDALIPSDLPDSLKGIYKSKIELFEQIINELAIFSSLSNIVDDLKLGLNQRSRIEQYNLLKNPSQSNEIKIIFDYPQHALSKQQLIEMLDYFSHFSDASLDILLFGQRSAGHAVSLYIKDQKFHYYNPDNQNRTAAFDTAGELADHIMKSYFLDLDDVKSDNMLFKFRFQGWKFYPANENIPPFTQPTTKLIASQNSPNHFSKLHYAIMENDIDKVKACLKTDVNDIFSMDSQEMTPLHLAMMPGKDPAILDALLNVPELDINKEYPPGQRTLLFYAILYNMEVSVIEKILAHGKINLEIRGLLFLNESGSLLTPLETALDMNNENVVKLLLQHGAKIDCAKVNIDDRPELKVLIENERERRLNHVNDTSTKRLKR